MGWESRFQLSRAVSTCRYDLEGRRRTEVSNEECLLSIRSPFSIDDTVVFVNIESEDLGTLLKTVSALWTVTL